ncbi:MAG: DUF2142 domain-containing protein [Lachnospiraceae bacterium]|nr:DUF2142 domain-containing protein [Lachnospiraceae bacterium]
MRKTQPARSGFWMLLFFSVLFGLLLEAAQVRNTPYSKTWDMPEHWIRLNQASVRTVEYEITNGVYTPSGADPKLIIDTEGLNVRTIRIFLEEPFDTDNECQVYYSNEEESFYPDRIERLVFRGGEKSGMACIPGDYGYIRIDIDESFTLDKILVSEEYPIETGRIRVRYRFLNAVLWALCAFFIGNGIRKRETFRNLAKTVRTRLRERKKKPGTAVLITVLCAAAGAAIPAVYFLAGLRFNLPAVLFTVCFLFTAAGLIVFREALPSHPEWFFALAAGGLVLFSSLCLPVGRITRDLESHYRFAEILSYQGETVYTPADRFVVKNGLLNSYLPVNESEAMERLLSFESETYDLSYDTVKGQTYAQHVLKHVGNIPNAMGLYLGRAMGLTFTWRFRLGRLMSGLIYILVLWGAIRILPYGKMVLVCIGLFPTNLLMASNYAYDPMVTAWIALGLSYFLRQYYEKDAPFQWGDGLRSLLCTVLGCLSKAVYFPVVFLLLLLPSGRFTDRKRKYLWRGLVALSVLFLILSFMLPFLTSTQAGDARGGAGVNAGEQVRYILTNPLAYTGTLLRFLMNYLSVKESYAYIGHYAYLGILVNALILAIVLSVVCFTEDYPDEIPHFRTHQAVAALAFFASVCLAVTALYVSFTPVGADFVAGCESRYITPVLFPLLSFLHFRGGNPKIDRRISNGLIFAVFIVFNYYGLFQAALRYMQ